MNTKPVNNDTLLTQLPWRYDEILGLAAQGFHTVVLGVVGYRAVTGKCGVA